ncbi:cytochrome P450 10-like [Asterias rubens]|uniref:cytochrome P450 10-like n=1 Tax=Asterias rubens TaxID=7604 RepID=UPI00145552BE|nr:cytochrome P450 10-like [Asterias rubens]XP_033626340.1 cytochrome P450 10-like [Asterias rubens]XP_033626341.1 cytochrome P450 10-like [Asterias rubens]
MFSALQSNVMVQLAKAAAESRPVHLVRMATTSCPVNAAQAGVCPLANHDIRTSADVLTPPASRVDATSFRTTGANALSTAKPYDEMPGPRGLPVLGSLLDYTKLGNYSLEKMHEAIVDRFKQYGPIYKENIAGAEAVHILDPKDVADLFRMEGKTPRRIIMEPMAHYRKIRKKNAGIANLQGEQWKTWRSSLQHVMLKPNSVATWIPSMEECATDFIDLMAAHRDQNGEVPNYLGQIYKWALESSFSVILGKRIGCLNPTAEDTNSEAANLISSTMDFFTGLCNLTFGFPLYKYGIRTKAWANFAAVQDYIYNKTAEHVTQYINDMRERDVTSPTANQTQGSDQKATVINYLLTKDNFEFEDICTLTNDLLFAAIDTTSNLLAFCLYCLAKNPEVQERLYEEVSRELPVGTPATAEALQNIPYLKAFVKETVRVYPPVDGTSRISNHDISIRGYRIPANTLVRVHCLSGRMPQYFKDPEQFKPERWIRGHEDCENIDPFLVLPFGTGSRMCVGRRLAEQEIYLLMARLVQRFRVEWHHEDMDYLFRLTNVPSRPLELSFVDRA